MLEVQNLTYTEAWALWFRGESTAGYFLWGVKILWLGRIGKIVGFIGALTIIAEIVGAERIRLFGGSLHQRFSIQKAKHHIKMAFSSFELLFSIIDEFHSSEINEHNTKELTKRVKSFLSTPVGTLTAIIIFSTTLLNILGIFISPSPITAIFMGIWCLAVVYSLAPIISTLVILLLLFILFLIDVIFIEPFAWILERKSLDKLLKITNVLMIIIGFHFDLLAS